MTRANLLTKLATALTPSAYALIMHIAAEAEILGYPAYLVGGPVRDMLLEQPVNDIDIVFEGAAIPLARRLASGLGGHALTHDRFGTAKWILDDPDHPPIHPLTRAGELPPFIDLISARRETYEHPAALPTVTFAGMKEDLFRRDFVLNTLALRLNGKEAGQLLDLYGGLSDLREGRIRILHDASFIDDPTRIFRALRFEQRLNFLLDPHTRHLMQSAVTLIELLSPDRVRHELILLLDEPEAAAMLEKMARWHMIPYIFPGVRWTGIQTEKVEAMKMAGVTATVALLAAVLWGSSVEVVESVSERLGLSHHWHTPLRAVAELQHDPFLIQPSLANSALYFRLHKVEPQAIQWLAQLTDNFRLRARLRLFLDDLRHRSMPISGDDLKAMGLKPGKQYQVILDKVRAAVMDDINFPEKPEDLLLVIDYS